MNNPDLIKLREQQHDLYVKIADAHGEVLEDLLAQVWEVDARIDAIENPISPPLTKPEFESEYILSRKYQTFCEDYGDSAALYSDYVDCHYFDYLYSHENRQKYYI